MLVHVFVRVYVRVSVRVHVLVSVRFTSPNVVITYPSYIDQHNLSALSGQSCPTDPTE